MAETTQELLFVKRNGNVTDVETEDNLVAQDAQNALNSAVNGINAELVDRFTKEETIIEINNAIAAALDGPPPDFDPSVFALRTEVDEEISVAQQTAIDTAQQYTDQAVNAVNVTLTQHLNDFNNPHEVTAQQVGAGSGGGFEINGIAAENLIQGDTVKGIDGEPEVSALANPETYSTQLNWPIFNFDGSMMALRPSSGIKLYDTTTVPFSIINFNPYVPTPTVQRHVFNHDGTRYANAGMTMSGISVNIADTTLDPVVITESLGDAANNAMASDICYNNDGTILAIAYSATIPQPLFLYDTTTIPYTKLPNPSVSPASAVGCCFDNVGNFFAVWGDNDLYLYDTTTTPWTKLSNPASYPTLPVPSSNPTMQFSSDSKIFCMSNLTSPRFYDTTTIPFTEIILTDPVTGYCSLSKNSNELATYTPISQSIGIYDVSKIPFEKLLEYPLGFTISNAGIKLSPEGTYLAITGGSPNYLTILEIVKQVSFYKANKKFDSNFEYFGTAQYDMAIGETGIFNLSFVNKK